MALIERTISIAFQHRVYFTRNSFGLGNPLLKEVLAGSFATPSPPSDGGEGRGEEARVEKRLPLSPALSPLLRRGE